MPATASTKAFRRDSHYYRCWAEEMRRVAEEAKTDECRDALLRIASQYDDNARVIERVVSRH